MTCWSIQISGSFWFVYRSILYNIRFDVERWNEEIVGYSTHSTCRSIWLLFKIFHQDSNILLPSMKPSIASRNAQENNSRGEMKVKRQFNATSDFVSIIHFHLLHETGSTVRNVSHWWACHGERRQIEPNFLFVFCDLLIIE
jgi:hypothetical protein